MSHDTSALQRQPDCNHTIRASEANLLQDIFQYIQQAATPVLTRYKILIQFAKVPAKYMREIPERDGVSMARQPMAGDEDIAHQHLQKLVFMMPQTLHSALLQLLPADSNACSHKIHNHAGLGPRWKQHSAFHPGMMQSPAKMASGLALIDGQSWTPNSRANGPI